MRQSIVLLMIIMLSACKKQETEIDYLGIVNLEVSGKTEAIPEFEKGLLLLHSFEYQDAREAFLKAQDIDSTMVMAYWGEAMTYNHPLWKNQNYENGFAAVKKMKAINKTNQLTELERDLAHAAEKLYKPKTAKKERDQDYMHYMEALYKKHPNNHEIAAFYSLSLLGSVSEGRNDSIYGLGANIANKILSENAQHPGALHYLIHSYDDPDHAHLALNVADSYAKVAPDASHALHMPSHIYVALGMWDKVISSNIDSYQASVNRMNLRDLGNDARGYHAYHWLEYGYLQNKHIEEAEKMVFDMLHYENKNPSKRARMYLLFLKGTFLAETNLWEHPISDIEVDVSDLNIAVRAQNYFLDGMQAFKAGNKNALDALIADMEKGISKETLLVDNINSGFTVCASTSRVIPDQSDINQSNIMKVQLKALQSWMVNDLIEAEALLKESVHLQDELSYSYGPPFILKPTPELYAEFLLAQNRPQEAIALYKKSLKKGTKRLVALEGIKRSASMLGDTKVLENLDLELSKI
ncbi:hypothetical protein [Changchengzhania lutea]|uniref:hypothetical protein n=1 Tax=Changchengzhania lutea TaxID=2049305 RepID=UPI00115C554D|nr:hypothetical protein [Changchengzhania lutea]